MNAIKKVGHQNQMPGKQAFDSLQLSLFQDFLCNTPDQRDNYSNTIELWDGIPKYHVSRLQMKQLRTPEGHLPTITREFRHGDRRFKIEIRPARIKVDDQTTLEYYPSAREELVEDALRKIAAEQSHGFLDRSESGVVFSLDQLRRELSDRGHPMPYPQVVEALDIMASCSIKVTSLDDASDYQSPVLTSLTRVTRKQYLENPSRKCVAMFSPLVTQSITQVTYRQYDYHTMMQHRFQISRYIHKRLAHNYINAAYTHPYAMLYSSLKRDSGLLQEYSRERDAIAKVNEALDELKTNGVLSYYTKEVRTEGPRRTIVDVKYELIPSMEFVSGIKAANKRQTDGQRKLADLRGTLANPTMQRIRA